MKFADCVKETTNATTAAVITLLGAVVTGKFRRFVGAFQVGETEICARLEDNAGNWEISLFTLTNASTLTRTEILSSSNNGAAVSFTAGAKDVFCTLSSEALASFLSADDGLTVEQLPTASTIADADYLTLTKPGNGDFKVTVAALKAAFGGTPAPGDTTAPTVSSAQVANAAPNVITITFNEALAATTPPASAFTASGGKTVSSVSISGAVVSLTVNSAYAAGNTITVGYVQPGSNPRLQDAVSNAVATFSGRAVTNNIAPSGSTVTGVTVSPSTASVAGGATQQFGATVTGTNSPSQGVNWSASAGSISAAGLFTAPAAGNSAQNITITATSQQDGTKSGAATATVAGTAPQTDYNFTPYNGNAFKSSLAFASLRGSAPNKYAIPGTDVNSGYNTVNPYWNINNPSPPKAYGGWGTSATTPPPIITATQNGGTVAMNGMAPMTKSAGDAWTINTYLWATAASGPLYFWAQAEDANGNLGVPECLNPDGMMIT